MPVGDGNEGDRITITRADGFSLVMMGNTPENAREWRNAIKDTLDILDSIYGDSRSTSGKIRRSNLATYYDDNENNGKFDIIEKSPQTIQILNNALHNHFLLKNIVDLTPLINSLQQQIFLTGDLIMMQVNIFIILYYLILYYIIIIFFKIIYKIGYNR